MSATQRRKRVQVGWFCDHTNEPYGERTHMSSHGRWKRGKFVETLAEPNTITAHSGLDYHDPKKRPACPLAEPTYVYREVTS